MTEPKTLEDLQEERESILHKMGKQNMCVLNYVTLSEELEEVDIKIEELKSELS